MLARLCLASALGYVDARIQRCVIHGVSRSVPSGANDDWRPQVGPVPQELTVLQVQPEAVGDVASRLIKAGFVIDGFPIGKPAVDAAILNVSNVPLEMRG